MNKAIIITRSSEYSAHNDFYEAIKNRESCQYKTHVELLNFLLARKEWKEKVAKWKGEIEKQRQCGKKVGELDIYFYAYREIFNEDPPGTLEKKEDYTYDAVRRLLDTYNLNNTHEYPSFPYASFTIHEGTEEWEVILVLYDFINIEKYECVDPLDLFLDSICKDLELLEAGNNVLFAHAEQIGLCGDGMLMDNHTVSNYSNDPSLNNWVTKNVKRFNRIAYFVHERKDENFFKVNILSKKFLGENYRSRGRREFTIDNI